MRPDKIHGNVFVANLPVGMTDEQLAEVFDPYGMVLSAYLARDPASGTTRGHGLVQIAPDKAADAAIAALHETELGGRRIEVRRADPGMSLSPPRRSPAPFRGTRPMQPHPGRERLRSRAG